MGRVRCLGEKGESVVFYHLALRPQKPQMDQVAQLNPGGPNGPGETQVAQVRHFTGLKLCLEVTLMMMMVMLNPTKSKL